MAHFWFAFDIGAYEDSTAHLSMLQDGAYNRLIRHYYKTGKAIPNFPEQIQRISGAHSEEEIEAITYILKTFFRLKPDGYHNKRADKEILKAKQLSKLRAISAKRRWDDKRHANDMQLHNSTNAKADTVTVTVTDTLKPKVKSKSIRAHFAIPSLGEVTAYCQERGNSVDPQKWFNHYTANGWMVGRNAMKDWRAAVRTWESNGNGRPQTNQNQRQPALTPTRAEVRQVGNFLTVAAGYGLVGSVRSTEGGGSTGVGNPADKNGAEQAPGHQRTSARVVEGEIKKLP